MFLFMTKNNNTLTFKINDLSTFNEKSAKEVFSVDRIAQFLKKSPRIQLWSRTYPLEFLVDYFQDDHEKILHRLIPFIDTTRYMKQLMHLGIIRLYEARRGVDNHISDECKQQSSQLIELLSQIDYDQLHNSQMIDTFNKFSERLYHQRIVHEDSSGDLSRLFFSELSTVAKSTSAFLTEGDAGYLRSFITQCVKTHARLSVNRYIVEMKHNIDPKILRMNHGSNADNPSFVRRAISQFEWGTDNAEKQVFNKFVSDFRQFCTEGITYGASTSQTTKSSA